MKLKYEGELLEQIDYAEGYSWADALQVIDDEERFYLLGLEGMLAPLENAVDYAIEEMIDEEDLPQIGSIVRELIEKAGEHIGEYLTAEIRTSIILFIDNHTEGE